MAEISKIQIQSGTYDIKDGYLREKAISSFLNVSAMKSSQKLVENMIVKTLGFYSKGDDGGAYYLVRERTNLDLPNEMNLIELYDNSLIAELIIENVVNVKQFGAKGDGSTDDTDSLQLAISQNKNLVFPKGEYVVDDSLDITADNIVVYGNNSTLKPTHSGDCVNVDGDYIEIYNLNIDGGANYGYDVNGSFCKLRDLTISNTYHSAIMLIGSNNLIDGVTGIENGWDCVSNYGTASYNVIQNCNAIKCKRHGFSTDPSTHDISFVNCYCENIGNPSLDEPHSCYHFEYSSNGTVNNCRALYDNTHPSITDQSTNSRYVGVRSYHSDNVIIDNLKIDYKNGFAPLNVSSVLNCEASNGVKLLNSTILNNSSNQNVGYIYIANGLDIINCKLYNVCFNEQDGYAGQLKILQNCEIELTSKPYFADFKYTLENAIISGNKFKGNSNVNYFINGNYINCIIKDNIFDTAKAGLKFTRDTLNASNTPRYNKVEDCTFKDCENMIYYVHGVNGTNYVHRCMFTGTCNYVVNANYNWFYMTECFKNNLTVNNANIVNGYFTLFDDMLTQFDYVSKALNPSNARYKISVNGSGQVIATAE